MPRRTGQALTQPKETKHMNLEFKQQMEAYALRARSIAKMCDNEQQTKVSLINPYLEMLGYDVRDPRHVRLEYRADFHAGNEKVDYLILRDGVPWAVIEAKSASEPFGNDSPTRQIQRYAMAAAVQYVAYTNGLLWRWFRKEPGSAMLETRPFIEHDATEPEDREVRWLDGIRSSSSRNVEDIDRISEEERLQSDFTAWFESCKADPPDPFLKLLLHDSGHRATAAMIQRAKQVWRRVVAASAAAQLSEASKRFRGESSYGSKEESKPLDDSTPSATVPEREGPARKLWRFRWRPRSTEAWFYERNGTEVQIAIAEHLLGPDSALSQHEAMHQLNQKFKRDSLPEKIAMEIMPDAAVPKGFKRLPARPNVAIYTQIATPVRLNWFARAMRMAPSMEIETEQGERDAETAEDQWPWKSIRSVLEESAR